MSKTITISDETWGKIKDQVQKEKKKEKIIIYKKDGSILYQSDKPTLKEAVIENGANLREANLCEADLREANLCEAHLYGANLCGADLCEANLRAAKLCGADLIDKDRS